MIIDENNEGKEPTGKVRNIKSGGNILDDSFFELDDSLGEMNFSKLGEDTHDSISDIISDDNIKLSPKEEDTLPARNPNSKTVKTSTLPTVKLNRPNSSKESDMNNIPNKKQLESMGFDESDPNAAQLKEIWDDMSTPSASEFKLMVSRMEPQMIKGTKISGYLETFHLPTTIPDIIEQIGQRYGGGKFQIRIVDGAGRYVKSKSFEISGLPKIPSPDQVASAKAEETRKPDSPDDKVGKLFSSKTSSVDDEAEEEEDEDEDFEPLPRRRLRPVNSMYEPPYSPRMGSYSSPYSGGFSDPYSRTPSFKKDDAPSKEDLDKLAREMEEKVVNKLENKFDKIVDLVSNKKSDSMLNADVVKALAPVFVAWMDNKSNKDTSQAGQFTEMNKQVVNLMQGMQDLVRLGDKSKEDFAERERKEREQNRREMLDHQAKLEERFLEQQRQAELRHQAMLGQMKEVLENKHQSTNETEARLRLEYEKMREEFRQREEQARREAREREDRLREEIRQREEEARRREFEQMNKLMLEERRWQEEQRRRDEEARQKEIAAREELRLKELEITSRLREFDSQKSDLHHKLLEQIYNNNLGNRESQLHMELAIAKMTSENEAKMLQANAQMELEKIRHATQMQMSKMKHELTQVESKKEDDPFAATMQEYLQRKLQIDMVKELNLEVSDDDLPSKSFFEVIKKLLAEGGGPLLQLLLGGLGGLRASQPNAIPGRVVNPSPAPAQPKYQHHHEEEDEDEDEEDMVEEEEETSEPDEQEDSQESGEDSEQAQTAEEQVAEEEEQETAEQKTEEPAQAASEEFYGIDPMQEIPRVAAFFEYLKESIEVANVSPVEAAKEAEVRLSLPIVTYLRGTEDSRVVIAQLQPLLENMYSKDFVEFFTKEETVEWMNKMLAALAGKPMEQEAVKENTAKKPSRKKKTASSK